MTFSPSNISVEQNQLNFGVLLSAETQRDQYNVTEYSSEALFLVPKRILSGFLSTLEPGDVKN